MNKYLNYVLLIIITGLAVLFFALDPAKHTVFPKCIFNSITGYYCPGCGSQRAVHSLLHLDLAGVVGYNFLFIPGLLLVLFHYSRPLLNRWLGWKLPNIFYFKSTPWIILAVVLVFFVLRNLPYYPFSVLAPG